MKNWKSRLSQTLALGGFLMLATGAAEAKFPMERVGRDIDFAHVQTKIVGVGIALRTEQNRIFVENIVPHGPADKSGAVRVDDEVLAVKSNPSSSWVSVPGRPLAEIVGLIRGEVQVPVELQLRNAHGQDISVTLVREEINVED